MAFSRIDEEGDELLVVCNFSDTACNYKLGLPEEKTYTVIFDSNLTRYGGTQTEENRRILPVPREYGSFDQYAELGTGSVQCAVPAVRCPARLIEP